jgi:hypothetical protein
MLPTNVICPRCKTAGAVQDTGEQNIYEYPGSSRYRCHAGIGGCGTLFDDPSYTPPPIQRSRQLQLLFFSGIAIGVMLVNKLLRSIAHIRQGGHLWSDELSAQASCMEPTHGFKHDARVRLCEIDGCKAWSWRFKRVITHKPCPVQDRQPGRIARLGSV